MSIKVNEKIIDNKIKHIFLFITSIILFWGYIYRFKIIGFPFSTSQILAILGSAFLFVKIFLKKKIVIDSDLFVFFISFIIPFLVISITSLINSEADFSIMKHFLGIPWNLLAFYSFKSYRNKTNQNLSFNDVALLFIITGLIQCFISLAGFLIPDIGRFLINTQVWESEAEKIRAGNFILNRRLIGLGAKYFGGGIIYSIDLVLITHLMLDKENSKEKYYKYLPLFYMIVFCCGMMMARTTLVGLFFSSLYFIKSSIKTILRILKNIVPSVLFLFIVFSILFFNYGNRIQKIINFGFEIFINLSEGRGLNTSSSDGTIKMYKFPGEYDYKTWLIGDALFFDKTGHYYRRTDVGYCRAIFYFGLLGFFVVWITQGLMAFIVAKRIESKNRFFFIIMCLMFAAFNLKGWAVLHLYLIPFYFIDKPNLLRNSNEGSYNYA